MRSLNLFCVSSFNKPGERRPLTGNFKQTMVERVRRGTASLFLNGEPATARVILRDLVNATVGFEGLAAATARPSKSLHRMLSVSGNPSMDNLAAIFDVLRRNLQVDIEVRAA